MATWVGHGIVGAAAAKAMGGSVWAQALAFALANAPDLDLLLGLALEGDAAALHRQWWNHSPIVALYGLAGAPAAYGLVQALRRRRLVGREARYWAIYAALVLLTHPLADFVLLNPTVLVPRPEGFPQAAGRELLALVMDLVFYGLLMLGLYRLYLRLRGQYRRRAA